MTVGDIFEDVGSSLTLYAFIMDGATERLRCNGMDPGNVYWWPIKEKRQEPNKAPVEVVTGIKMSFRYKEDAERSHAFILKSDLQ